MSVCAARQTNHPWARTNEDGGAGDCLTKKKKKKKKKVSTSAVRARHPKTNRGTSDGAKEVVSKHVSTPKLRQAKQSVLAYLRQLMSA
jgi:hypothetical protein